MGPTAIPVRRAGRHRRVQRRRERLTAEGVKIIGNVVFAEHIDVAVKTSGAVGMHRNDLFDAIEAQNLGAPTVDATQSSWKCSSGPDTEDWGNTRGPTRVDAWLEMPCIDRPIRGPLATFPGPLPRPTIIERTTPVA